MNLPPYITNPVYANIGPNAGLVEFATMTVAGAPENGLSGFAPLCNVYNISDGSSYQNFGNSDNADWEAKVGLLRAEITLTSTQIKQLFTTPIEVIPAPGVGKYILPVRLIRKTNYTGPVYTQPGNTNIVMGGQSLFQLGQFIISSSQVPVLQAANTVIALTENTPALAVNTIGNPTNGNSSVTFIIYYQIADIEV